MAVGTWKPAVGSDTAGIRLAKVWSVIAFTFFLACLEYESNALEKGIEAAGLISAGQVLQAPFEIDPRGGFLGQEAFEEGLELTIAKSAALKVKFEEAAASKGIELGAIVTLCAFKIRVMLSHLRIKRRAWLKQDSAAQSLADPSLITLYQSINTGSSSGSKKTAKPQNPFINFREVSESENEAEQEDGVVKPVATYFDPAQQQAINLMSDGTVIPATKYQAHSDGFIKAEWYDDEGNLKSTFDCEVPNSCLVHGLVVTAAPTASLVVKSEGDDEGKEEDTEDVTRKPAAAKRIIKKRPATAKEEAEAAKTETKKVKAP
jgi:hypothetical protein